MLPQRHGVATLCGLRQALSVPDIAPAGAAHTMASPKSSKQPSHFHLSDLRGLTQLGVDATIGVTGLVEQLHGTISRRAAPLGRPDTAATSGLTGFVYGSIRGIARTVAGGLGAGLAALEGLLPGGATSSPQREAMLAALNGVYGDHLVASGNPLATEMGLYLDGERLPLTREAIAARLPAAGNRVLLLVHGLCMNDQQWQRHGHHHGAHLARVHGYTVLALRYNSGLHVAQNGSMLADLLARLQALWPLQALSIVGHSMGGLVARAAIAVAEQRELAWRQRLGTLVCLGTPHLGAALERGGHLVDTLLELSPYAAPFARLGKARSAGITDLRYGRLRPHGDPQARQRVPLPQGVACYAVAATRSEEGTAEPARSLRGDGLVSLASAWGEHQDPTRALELPATHKRLLTAANHWDLLSRAEVADWLTAWLKPRG